MTTVEARRAGRLALAFHVSAGRALASAVTGERSRVCDRFEDARRGSRPLDLSRPAQGRDEPDEPEGSKDSSIAATLTPATTNTRIVPAIAVPKVEPQVRTRCARPRSRLHLPGKLDWTTFAPKSAGRRSQARPTSRSPGTKATTSRRNPRSRAEPIPARVARKPPTVGGSLSVASSRGAVRQRTRTEDAHGRGGEDGPCRSRCTREPLQEPGDHERHARRQKPLHVLRDDQIARAVPQQPCRQKDCSARSRPR